MVVIPTSYTSDELAEYMATIIGVAAEIINITVPDGYEEPLIDTCLWFGVDDVPLVTDIALLRLVAKIEVLKFTLLRMSSVAYDFSVDGGSFSRSKIIESLQQQLDDAEAELAALEGDTGWDVSTGSMGYPDDPYAYPEPEDVYP